MQSKVIRIFGIMLIVAIIVAIILGILYFTIWSKPESETTTTSSSSSSSSSTTTPSPTPAPALTAIPTSTPAPYVPGTIPSNPTWTTFYSNDDVGGIVIDLGEQKSNELIGKSLIVKRECPTCIDSHKNIFYKRLTAPGTLSIYNNMKNTWSKEKNILNTDFKLFSSLTDVQTGVNGWNYCNYDDAGIGGFRDCGKDGATFGQWNSTTKGGPKVKYSALNVPA